MELAVADEQAEIMVVGTTGNVVIVVDPTTILLKPVAATLVLSCVPTKVQAYAGTVLSVIVNWFGCTDGLVT